MKLCTGRGVGPKNGGFLAKTRDLAHETQRSAFLAYVPYMRNKKVLFALFCKSTKKWAMELGEEKFRWVSTPGFFSSDRGVVFRTNFFFYKKFLHDFCAFFRKNLRSFCNLKNRDFCDLCKNFFYKKFYAKKRCVSRERVRDFSFFFFLLFFFFFLFSLFFSIFSFLFSNFFFFIFPLSFRSFYYL